MGPRKPTMKGFHQRRKEARKGKKNTEKGRMEPDHGSCHGHANQPTPRQGNRGRKPVSSDRLACSLVQQGFPLCKTQPDACFPSSAPFRRCASSLAGLLTCFFLSKAALRSSPHPPTTTPRCPHSIYTPQSGKGGCSCVTISHVLPCVFWGSCE